MESRKIANNAGIVQIKLTNPIKRQKQSPQNDAIKSIAFVLVG